MERRLVSQNTVIMERPLISYNMMERLATLENTVFTQQLRLNTLSDRITRNELRNVCIANDALDAVNVHRRTSVLFTNVRSSRASGSVATKQEIEQIMKHLEIDTYDVKGYEYIPWGRGFALKCTFASLSTCNHILQNVDHLHDTPYWARPDLCERQRALRSKLVNQRKYMENAGIAKCTILSWRYLLVVYSNGCREYYEASEFHAIPVKLPTGPKPMPLYLRK